MKRKNNKIDLIACLRTKKIFLKHTHTTTSEKYCQLVDLDKLSVKKS